ncbi:Pkinase-domain-containing protein [Tilletiaria anomala UBC 951]|uniref:Pkinase-domain-containing protein n=1 Tax=Tilletiaria anomala (strain ATCC 24038 / CBS 436.72 / UBC 951) TaxID=1037660 RepID=A0A066V1Q1_TILAU|nr:Pkinase-domain-containing protein [Tilletiaria anomala UBC 951]KDN35642.1 Pkinase-domain-containing protein [Tilletiaria anomala UBC 951]
MSASATACPMAASLTDDGMALSPNVPPGAAGVSASASANEHPLRPISPISPATSIGGAQPSGSPARALGDSSSMTDYSIPQQQTSGSFPLQTSTSSGGGSGMGSGLGLGSGASSGSGSASGAARGRPRGDSSATSMSIGSGSGSATTSPVRGPRSLPLNHLTSLMGSNNGGAVAAGSAPGASDEERNSGCSPSSASSSRSFPFAATSGVGLGSPLLDQADTDKAAAGNMELRTNVAESEVLVEVGDSSSAAPLSALSTSSSYSFPAPLSPPAIPTTPPSAADLLSADQSITPNASTWHLSQTLHSADVGTTPDDAEVNIGVAADANRVGKGVTSPFLGALIPTFSFAQPSSSSDAWVSSSSDTTTEMTRPAVGTGASSGGLSAQQQSLEHSYSPTGYGSAAASSPSASSASSSSPLSPTSLPSCYQSVHHHHQHHHELYTPSSPGGSYSLYATPHVAASSSGAGGPDGAPTVSQVQAGREHRAGSGGTIEQPTSAVSGGGASSASSGSSKDRRSSGAAGTYSTVSGFFNSFRPSSPRSIVPPASSSSVPVASSTYEFAGAPSLSASLELSSAGAREREQRERMTSADLPVGASGGPGSVNGGARASAEPNSATSSGSGGGAGTSHLRRQYDPNANPTTPGKSPRRPGNVFDHVGTLFGKGKKDREKNGSTGSNGSSGGGGAAPRGTQMTNLQHQRTGSRSSGTSPSGSQTSGRKTSTGGFFASNAMKRNSNAVDVLDEDASNSGTDLDRPSSIAYYASPSLLSQSSSGTISAAASPRGSLGLGLPQTLSESADSMASEREGNVGDRAVRPSTSPTGERSSLEKMEYLSSPGELRQRLSGCSSSTGSRSSLANAAKRISALDRVLIQVTEDNERFSVVDVSGMWSAEAIKEKMITKLHYDHADVSNLRLCRTEIGRSSIVDVSMDDDSLLAMCMQAGDDKGTLKFLVQANDGANRPRSGSDHQSQSRRHSRTESMSSRGSFNEQNDMLGKGSTLQRSRAANVRRIAIGSGSDEQRSAPSSARSPPGSATSGGPSMSDITRTDSPMSERDSSATRQRRPSSSQRDPHSQTSSWHEGSQLTHDHSLHPSISSPPFSPPSFGRRAESHSGGMHPVVHRAPSQPSFESAVDAESDFGHQRACTDGVHLHPQQGFMMHNAKSMEDLRGSPQNLQAELYGQGSERAGERYPPASASRPAVPPQPPSLLRQGSGDMPIRTPLFTQDPRYFRHPDSLRPHTAHTPGHQYVNGPRYMERSPSYNTEHMRTPSFGNTRPATSFFDPRMQFAPRPPMPATMGSHPRQQMSVSPNNLSFNQGCPNEFGARAPPFPNRPHTYHDQYRYAPTIRPPPPKPSPQGREDPFTAAYFPNTSTRQVSEFQRSATPLAPGRTIQETLVTRGPPTPGLPPGSPYAQRPMQHGSLDQDTHPSQQRYAQQGPYVHPQQPHPFHQQQQPQQQQRYTQHGQAMPQAGMQRAHTQQPSHDQQAAMTRAHTQQQQEQQQFSHSPVLHVGVPPHSLPSVPIRPERAPERGPPPRPLPGAQPSQTTLQRVSDTPSEPLSHPTSMEDTASAPTSARSSSSGPLSADFSRVSDGTKRTSSSTMSPYSPISGDMDDLDLMKIRPLPMPPGGLASSTEGSSSMSRLESAGSSRIDKCDEESDTLKAALWASLVESMKSGQQGHTSPSGNSKGDIGERTVNTVTSFPSDGSTATFSAKKSDEDTNGGTFASFASFDDDENETSGTWALPLNPDKGTLISIANNAAGSTSEASDQGASSHRRPELRVTIDPKGPTKATKTATSDPPRTASPLSMLTPDDLNVSELSTTTSIQRKISFARRDSDWAFRPPQEQLYEYIDEFFPKHDLDKPVLDSSTVPESPSGELSPKEEATTELVIGALPPAPLPRATRHKKSIRVVAQDRKRLLEKVGDVEAEPQVKEQAQSLARRRSTRLWGGQVLEMTPGTETTALQSSSQTDRPQFKWVKGELIGKGTYGRVYLALNASTGEMLAVKQVELPRTASDREDARQKSVVQALKSEIETLKDIDHPHIVAYLGFEETTSYLSIFLEYVPGGSVGSCLRKHGQFEEDTIKSFLHQILEALAYLHGKGILHRDLKADNILVDFNGICKISDFGTVRRSDDIYGNVENMSLQGSIFWMAPEVVSLSKKGYSAKVDIWSLGCVVLEMFAGRRPWSDEEAVQAMFKIGAQRRPPPIPPNVRLSKLAAHFLRNCFEIDPNLRPTASRLLEHRFPSALPEGWTFQQTALYRAISKPPRRTQK